MIKIKPTPEELSLADVTARRVIERALTCNFKDYTTGDHYTNHYRGFLCEIVVSKYLNIPWRGADLNTRHDGDVGDIEIKSTTPYLNLMLNERSNPDRRYVLTWVYADSICLVGWQHGTVIKTDDYRFKIMNNEWTYKYPYSKCLGMESFKV